MELTRDENLKRNYRFLDEFKIWLENKKLTEKTIRKHISNADLYVNDYLNYYEEYYSMEDGINETGLFFGDWFIRKCMWSSLTSLKETASSIKKFYECMCELGYVRVEEYKGLCKSIKERMPDYLDRLYKYDNGSYYDMF